MVCDCQTRQDPKTQRPPDRTALSRFARRSVLGARRLLGGTGQDAFALQALALQLAIAANGLRPLACPLLARLFVMAPQLHLAEDAFPLHLLLQRLQRLVDVVVANDNLQRLLRSFQGPR